MESKKTITHLVNADFVKGLIELGFSKNVSEKSLLLTNNVSVEAALAWIEKHQSDPDYEEEMVLADQPQGENGEPVPTQDNEGKPKRTKEEIEKAAKELQEKIRKKREIKDKEEAEAKEKDRIKGTKEMLDDKIKFEQEQRKRDLEANKKEKIDDALAKKKMLEILEKDKIEKYGDKYKKIVEERKKEAHEVKIDISYDSATAYVNQIVAMYDERNVPGIASGCLEYLCKYLTNLMKDPANDKFKKINAENKVFKEKIASIFNGVNVLIALGFKYDADSKMLVFSAPYNEEMIAKTIKYMTETIQRIPFIGMEIKEIEHSNIVSSLMAFLSRIHCIAAPHTKHKRNQCTKGCGWICRKRKLCSRSVLYVYTFNICNATYCIHHLPKVYFDPTTTHQSMLIFNGGYSVKRISGNGGSDASIYCNICMKEGLWKWKVRFNKKGPCSFGMGIHCNNTDSTYATYQGQINVGKETGDILRDNGSINVGDVLSLSLDMNKKIFSTSLPGIGVTAPVKGKCYYACFEIFDVDGELSLLSFEHS